MAFKQWCSQHTASGGDPKGKAENSWLRDLRLYTFGSMQSGLACYTEPKQPGLFRRQLPVAGLYGLGRRRGHVQSPEVLRSFNLEMRQQSPTLIYVCNSSR